MVEGRYRRFLKLFIASRPREQAHKKNAQAKIEGRPSFRAGLLVRPLLLSGVLAKTFGSDIVAEEAPRCAESAGLQRTWKRTRSIDTKKQHTSETDGNRLGLRRQRVLRGRPPLLPACGEPPRELHQLAASIIHLPLLSSQLPLRTGSMT